MAVEQSEGLDRVAAVLRTLAAGRLPPEIPAEVPLAADLEAVAAYVAEIQDLALDTSRGNLSPRVVRARGPIAGSLKALQAALRHLTWQTQRIAAGDLTQRVEFLGEFSDAFNRMVEQLEAGRRYEIQLRQAQRLEAVGQLAAGLAHEINTPAQFVNDSLHFLKETVEALGTLVGAYRRVWNLQADSEADRPGREEIAAAEQSADADYLIENAPGAADRALDGLQRIASIVEAMKEFSPRDRRRRQAPADLNHAIATTLTISSHEIEATADVVTELASLPPVVCDVDEIRQVLLNLLFNAVSAIRDAQGASGTCGWIRIATRAEGETVCIEISDTGCGIPEAIRGRIYDPFFTTRPVGQGRGQGLTIVHQVVVEKHRGAIDFESEVGRGTTFRIVLPIHPPAEIEGPIER